MYAKMVRPGRLTMFGNPTHTLHGTGIPGTSPGLIGSPMAVPDRSVSGLCWFMFGAMISPHVPSGLRSCQTPSPVPSPPCHVAVSPNLDYPGVSLVFLTFFSQTRHGQPYRMAYQTWSTLEGELSRCHERAPFFFTARYGSVPPRNTARSPAT